MNLLFISDIHGVKTNLPKIKERFYELQCDKLVVLGDLYYIGPRNSMVEGYDIAYVEDFLESFGDKLICIKGNCDSEVDKMVSKFPIINDLGLITTNHHELYLTHGHIFNENNWNYTNSILIYGHFHKPFIKEEATNIYINPGSISLPKTESGPSYLFYNESEFIIYDINDQVLFSKSV